MTDDDHLDLAFRRLASMRVFMGAGDPRRAPSYGRQIAANWIKQHSGEIPVSVKSEVLTDVVGRAFTPVGAPADEVLIYIHGGGLVYYDTSVFAPFLGQLAQRLNRKIIALDYNKAPNTPALSLFSDLEERVRTVVQVHAGCTRQIAGDSVGGLLAMLLCQSMPRDTFKDLHLIYPVVDDHTQPDDPFGTGHFLDTEMMTWFYDFIGPLFERFGVPIQWSDETLAKLPPTTCHIACCDILAAQAGAFVGKLGTVNSLSRAIRYPALPHDFCLYTGAIHSAQVAFDTLADAIKDRECV